MELEDGVYLHLPFREYIGDRRRIGQSDMVPLHDRPHDWWAGSHHNPNRVPRQRSEDMDWGSGLHALLFQGEEAYQDEIGWFPSYEDFRPSKHRIARDMAMSNGLVVITPSMDRRIRLSAALVREHPDLARLMELGIGEVSIMFELDGVKIRTRIDWLLPKFIIELKSFGGFARGKDLEDRSIGLVKARHYDIQRYVYDVARQRLVEFVRDGKVFQASQKEMAWLTRLANMSDDWSWIWVFAQRPDDKKGWGPAVKPIIRPRFDLTFDTGRQKAAKALENYKRGVQTFGLEAQWAELAPMTEPQDLRFSSYEGEIAYDEGDFAESA